MRLPLIALCLLFYCINLHAQSSSVFDAAYFENNSEPPIKVGKGFHINDIFKQTRSCFTPESCSMSKLTSQQTGGRKTTVKMFYTKTNAEYNDLKRRGRSGKVSFLSLFNAGSDMLNQYSNTTVVDRERLVFTINVDFGIFSFERDPILMPEAKTLITQNKLHDFTKMYGTHYISGIRKESSISLVLTKYKAVYNSNSQETRNINAGVHVPVKGLGSFEIEDGSWINQELSTSKYDIKIEVNGPGINQQVLQQQVGRILNGDGEDKMQAISEMLSSAAEQLNDPGKAMITQFYYTPYSLYGLKGIYWDQKKEKELMQLNEAIIQVYAAKTKLDELVKPSGKRQIEAELRNSKVPQEYIDEIITAYSQEVPKFQELKTLAEGYLDQLQTRYTNCADVYCEKTSDCCNNNTLLNEIVNDPLDERLHQSVDKLMVVTAKVQEEVSKPECEKLQQGTIIIQNLSANPYALYNGDQYLGIVGGNSSKSFQVPKGAYSFRAVQKSGYVFYATVNKRTATVTRSCQEVKITIGYEDK